MCRILVDYCHSQVLFYVHYDTQCVGTMNVCTISVHYGLQDDILMTFNDKWI